jgi:hypothetical protein
MLAAWISARVSGNWLGGLCGLTLGLFCVSQNSVADRLVSDTLFGLLLTLAVAALIAWFRRPTVIAAMFVGLLLGLATLVRPIAQFAWVPILVAMAFRLSNSPRSYSGEGQKVRTNVSPRPHSGEGQGMRANDSPLAHPENDQGVRADVSPLPYSGEGQGVRANVSPLPRPWVHGARGEGQVVRDLDLRRLLAHSACLLVAFAIVLAPWYARNYYCCGQAFLSKAAGLTMWQSLFKSNSPLDPPVPFADAPKTRTVLARLDRVNLQSHWAVLKELQEQGLTRMEAIDLMQAVDVEAIKAHPWKFVDSRLRRFAWFWITPNGTGRPRTPEFHMNEERAAEAAPTGNLPGTDDYCGQAHWCWDGFYRDGRLNWLWHPNPWLYLSTAAMAGCGIVVLLFDREQRAIAVALGMLLVYFAGMTAIGAPPEYRYRMVVEPILIVSIVQLLLGPGQDLLKKVLPQGDVLATVTV